MKTKRKALGIKQQEEIKKNLEDALRSASMKNANFNNAINLLPTTNNEVTDFIKERIKLYMDSWVIDKIQRVINELNV